MNLPKAVASAKKKKYLIISELELKELLALSKIIIEENTYISDKIRLLKFKDELILQEKSTKDEYLIRIMKTKKEAEELIKERLEIYNRMWDGCGCRIDYYK
jgi:predicted site-specific integrase-resolvase